ncbi:hypothetical protein EsH8_I_000167 [Colletotrichum jinshuiense]
MKLTNSLLKSVTFITVTGGLIASVSGAPIVDSALATITQALAGGAPTGAAGMGPNRFDHGGPLVPFEDMTAVTFTVTPTRDWVGKTPTVRLRPTKHTYIPGVIEISVEPFSHPTEAPTATLDCEYVDGVRYCYPEMHLTTIADETTAATSGTITEAPTSTANCEIPDFCLPEMQMTTTADETIPIIGHPFIWCYEGDSDTPVYCKGKYDTTSAGQPDIVLTTGGWPTEQPGSTSSTTTYPRRTPAYTKTFISYPGSIPGSLRTAHFTVFPESTMKTEIKPETETETSRGMITTTTTKFAPPEQTYV